jgi:hypothetical protein
MAITRKNSKTNKRNKRVSKNTKKTSKRSNSSKRNGSKNSKVRKPRKSVKGVRKMKGGDVIEINLREYFPIDTGTLFSTIEDFYYKQTDTFIKDKDTDKSKFLIHPIRDYDERPPYFSLRLLGDNYNYVIINKRYDMKDLLIFKIDGNNLYKIFTIRQKSREELGTIINENNIIPHSDTDKFEFVLGLPEFPWDSYHIFKIGDRYESYSSNSNSLLDKETVTGYYNLNPKQISPPEPTLKPTPAKKPGFLQRLFKGKKNNFNLF